MRLGRTMSTTALALLVVGVAAGCGADTGGGGSGAGGSGAGGSGAGGGGAGGGTVSGIRASGTPVRVMAILDESDAANVSLPDARAGILARVKRINETGNGLGGSGRPVEVVFCRSEVDPNKAADCARQAAGDPSIVAVVGSAVAEDVNPILAAAGLANIGPAPLSAGDFTSPTAFNTSGGSVAEAGGEGAIACRELHLARINAGRVQLDVAAQATQLVNQVLGSWHGAPLGRNVDIPVGATDVSAQVSAMADGADAVVLAVLPVQAQQVLLARRQLGVDTPFLATAQMLTAQALTSLGDAAEGTDIAALYPTDDVDLPGNRAYVRDMRAAGGYDQADDTAKGGWVAFDLFDHVARGLATINRATVLRAMRASADYNAGGLTPTLNFAGKAASPMLPRLYNLTYFHARVHDGKFVSAGSGRSEPVFGGG
jgi:ABC-type branched-subunit amino acid transport system substrate-binding protein